MRDRLLFYLKHALRSLQRERRRSLFAIFAIAVGVAAIVSLQSLGLSIRDSVTEDIQATHQADVVVSTNSDEGFSPEQKSALDGLASRGRFDDWTWFFLANPDRPSFVAASDELEAQPLQWLQPYLVEPGNYPLYGEIRSIEPDDVPLSRLLTARGDVVLSKDISRRMGVGVGDGVVFENSGTFIVKGIVSNEASGGVFAPYFIPPMPWFAYLDLNDLRAQEVFGVGEGDASVLFIKTRDDDEAETLAREIGVTAFLVNDGLLDSPVAGNVFVHLSGPNVGLRDLAFQEISSIDGVRDVVEYHEFGEVTRLAIDGEPSGDFLQPHLETLVTRSITPAETTVEILRGRPLWPEVEGRPVLVVRGPEGLFERINTDLDKVLGRNETFSVMGEKVTLETVGVTRDTPTVPGGFGDATLLAPLGAINPAIPRMAISFSMTVPDSELSDVVDRLNRSIPGVVAVGSPTVAGVMLVRNIEITRVGPIEVETAEERLPEIKDTTDTMGKFIMVVGLVSLAIGGIGILNTMLVVVGTRTAEVAILKALGLKGRQVTLVFMVEGAMLGIAGSIASILLGVLLSYALTGFSEQFLQTDVGWKLQVAPVYTGLAVGIVATTVFGFLPVLAASRVRPNVLLQPQASVLPRAGRLISFFVVLLLTAVMGLIATVFLDDLSIAMIATYGALAVLTLLTVILLGVVWLVGKIPSFGSINLKLSLRGLSRQRGRAASTLLVLTVGIFAMASILVLGGSLKEFVEEESEDFVGGNVLFDGA